MHPTPWTYPFLLFHSFLFTFLPHNECSKVTSKELDRNTPV